MKTSKYSNCSICPLVDQSRCIGETNCKTDLSKVEVVILAEAPAKEEIKQNRPLVGKAGKVFREAFELSKLNQSNYMISNVVLCANIQDGKTVNPPKEAIDCCKPNWEALINLIKPKIILLMGTVPMQSFGISDAGITKKRGNIYYYNNIPVMLTLHPSYIMRQSGEGGYKNSKEWNQFVSDMTAVVDFLNNKFGEDKESVNDNFKNNASDININYTINRNNPEELKIITDQTKLYSFSLPSWCYKEDVSLFDIQHIYTENVILYIFKTKSGKKYHKVESSENYYYIGEDPEIADAPMLESIKNVSLVLGPSQYPPEISTYESDIKPEVKRTIDYRYVRKEKECDYPLLKMYVDIEVYNNKNLKFPDPKKAESPINAISFKIGDNPVNVWICRLPQMDKKEPNIPDGVLYKSYSSEYNLLQAFAKLVRETNPDILTGWNFLGFDMLTIYGRMLKLGIDPNLMSPVNTTHIDLKRYGCVFVYGIHVMDMLDLYKELTYSVEESYKLDFIGQKQLGIGKVSYNGTLDELFEENLSEFIRYSAVDTDILYQLDKKMGHIDLKNELIKICSTTWKTSESTMGLVDPLCVSYAKEQNLVCRNAVIEKSDFTIPGAYVRNPVKGRHNFVIDLDFSSLYPSIICSCNIGPNTYIGKINSDIAHDIIFCKDRLNLENTIDIILYPMRKNFTTKKIKIKSLLNTIEKKKYIVTSAGTIYKNHEEEISFLNKILTYLLNSRKEYKDLMKDAKRLGDDSVYKRYGNMQLAYKILANSIYGVLANHAFRFYNTDMAMSITLTGQELVKFSGWHLGQYMKEKN